MTSITQSNQQKLPGKLPRGRVYRFYFGLLELGVPSGVVSLYGVLERFGGKKRQCSLTREKMARKIGLRGRFAAAHISTLLRTLRDLHLVEWERAGPGPNLYRVLPIDDAWIATEMARLRAARRSAV